ncbi:MAG: DUF11 domain-containing protein, partial [Candidatus Magnetomorum sp.]|nr:DUF11 domain-containing protein [Candidatus Magnetomorum sp.]
MKHPPQRILWILLIFLMCCPSILLAGPLESKMSAYLVTTDQNGKETLKQTDSAAPGEVIEYVLTYHNTGKTTLSALAVNGPIPSNTCFVQGSNETKTPHQFTVSIDHGKTWDGEPVKRKRKNKDGKEVLVVIPPSEYTNVQWEAIVD